MITSLAHLFDYDNVNINKAEGIIDRFFEILNIPANRIDDLRDKLINFIAVKMILILVSKLPADFQEEAKKRIVNPDEEIIAKIKSYFTSEEVTNAFNEAFKAVMQEKYEKLKAKLIPIQSQQIEELLQLIGKY